MASSSGEKNHPARAVQFARPGSHLAGGQRQPEALVALRQRGLSANALWHFAAKVRQPWQGSRVFFGSHSHHTLQKRAWNTLYPALPFRHSKLMPMP